MIIVIWKWSPSCIISGYLQFQPVDVYLEFVYLLHMLVVTKKPGEVATFGDSVTATLPLLPIK